MDHDASTPHAGWEPLPPEHLPRPTYFPAGLAMGTAFVFWGVIASPVVLFAGIGLLIAASAGWISEIRHERQQQ